MLTRGMRSDEVNKGGASSMTSEQREIFSEIYIDNWPELLRYAEVSNNEFFAVDNEGLNAFLALKAEMINKYNGGN